MTQWIAPIMHVDHHDVDVQRRGRIAITVLIALLLGVASFIPLAFLGNTASRSSLPIILGAIGLLVAAGVVIRRGFVTAGVSMILLILTAVVQASVMRRGSIGVTPFYLVMVVLVAGVTLPPRAMWLVVALLYVLLGSTAVVMQAALLTEVDGVSNIEGAAVVIGVAAFISFLGARGGERALNAVQAAQTQVAEGAAALEQANAGLEQRIANRTKELVSALAVQQEQAAALTASLDQQRQLNALVNTLSVPIIPVRRDVLVVPLVGHIDAARVQQMVEVVLQAIEKQRARTVFLDITGVTTVDTLVAQALLQTAQAARLLGAEPVLIGVRPDVAQAMSGLGADMAELRSAASLESALDALPVRKQRAKRSVAVH